MSPALLKMLGVVALFAAGVWIGMDYQQGRQARAELDAVNDANELQRLVRRQMDQTSAAHVRTVETINQKLRTAHGRIATLERRDCLDPDTVGLLNDIGAPADGAAARQLADPAQALAARAGDGLIGLRYSTNADLAGHIAICRATYAQVSDQLDKILDIEDQRFPPGR